MPKARKKRTKPRNARIWFIGGPLDNHVVRWPWWKTCQVADPASGMESEYRLECLVTSATGSEGRTGNPWFDEENDGPTEFLAYVHESVTHAQLIERVYLTAHQPECGFSICPGEFNLQVCKAMSRATRKQ